MDNVIVPPKLCTMNTNDRSFNTGVKLRSGFTYFLAPKNDYWFDAFLACNSNGVLLPDFLIRPLTWLYEKIFSRRKFFPRERLGKLLYSIGDTGIKDAVGLGTYIIVPKKFKGEHTLYLFVNDYNTGSLKNNRGTIDVKVYEIGENALGLNAE